MEIVSAIVIMATAEAIVKLSFHAEKRAAGMVSQLVSLSSTIVDVFAMKDMQAMIANMNNHAQMTVVCMVLRLAALLLATARALAIQVGPEQAAKHQFHARHGTAVVMVPQLAPFLLTTVPALATTAGEVIRASSQLHAHIPSAMAMATLLATCIKTTADAVAIVGGAGRIAMTRFHALRA